MQITKRIIIGLIICFGLIVQTTNVHAIYSPTISKEVSKIKQHVVIAREHNGSGSITAAIESVKAQDDERAKEGKPRALPLEATIAIPRVLGYMFYDLIKAPLDPIYMIFNMVSSTNTLASTCLRNDIWILEDLRDIVAQEMIKAYLMMDSNNGDVLSNDYNYLRYHIDYLKEYGSRPQYPQPNLGDTIPITSSEYLFGRKSDVNYYSIQFPVEEVESEFSEEECKVQCMRKTCNETCVEECKEEDDVCGTIDCSKTCNESCTTAPNAECVEKCAAASQLTLSGCPESDFVEAFEEVKESLITLKTLSSGSGSDWGSILVMAKARARRRAEEWIKSNQISMTLGGEEGGNPQSLIKGDSWNVFVGQFKTQKQILKNMIGSLTPLFSWSIYSRGENGDEISYGCMYYHATAGTFRACTVEQLEDYMICEEIAEKQKTGEDKETEAVDICGKEVSVVGGFLRDTGAKFTVLFEEEEREIDCDKFRNPHKFITPTEMIENYQEQAIRHQKTITSTERTLKYNMNLTNVSEQNLIILDTVMTEINWEIMRGTEDMGNEAGKGLPTLYSGIATFLKNHCGGKNCP